MPQDTEALRAELISALAHHDWYYERSDDHREWARGREQRAHILELVKQVPDGQELYDKARTSRSSF